MAKRGESLRGQREDWTRSRGRRQEKATFGFKPWERGDLLLARTGERSLWTLWVWRWPHSTRFVDCSSPEAGTEVRICVQAVYWGGALRKCQSEGRRDAEKRRKPLSRVFEQAVGEGSWPFISLGSSGRWRRPGLRASCPPTPSIPGWPLLPGVWAPHHFWSALRRHRPNPESIRRHVLESGGQEAMGATLTVSTALQNSTECFQNTWFNHLLFLGFPGSSAVKETACNAGDPGSIPHRLQSRGSQRVGHDWVTNTYPEQI